MGKTFNINDDSRDATVNTETHPPRKNDYHQEQNQKQMMTRIWGKGYPASLLLGV